MEQGAQGVPSGTQGKSGKKIGCWIAGCLTALVIMVVGIVGIALWATKGPVNVAREQLASLKNGDMEGAYLLTSGDFRKVTSLDQFKNFIASNPSLANNKGASFTSRKIENDKGYIEGTLTAVDGSKTPIKYDLVKENNVWKIMYLEISPKGVAVSGSVEKAAEEPVSSKITSVTSIEKIEVGTQRASNGSMIDASASFPQNTGDIKVNAYIRGAKAGQKVNAIWFFGGQQITNPVANPVNEDGDLISQFYLGTPDNGWPAGSYKVVVLIDDGKIAKEMVYTIGQ